jgi:hypothetical protein
MICEHIAAYLQSIGHGTLGVNMFIDNLPETPDDVVLVTTSGGFAPEFVHNKPGVNTEMPTFQIATRSRSIPSAKSKSHAIYNDLQLIGNMMVDGIFFQRLTPMQTPFSIERDDKDRWIWGCNYVAEKEPG